MVEAEELFGKYAREKWGSKVQKVRMLSKDDMEEFESLRGCYDRGIRRAEAIVGEKTYDLQLNADDNQVQEVGLRSTRPI